MHPRAIVGPPGTTPQLNPHTGMPHLRRSLPGATYAQLIYGAGVHEMPTSSIQVDAPPIQANPPQQFGGHRMSMRTMARNPGRTTGSINGRALNPAGHEGAVSVGACFPKFDPVEMYGAGQPPPMPNPVAAGAFPGVDPMTGMPRLRARMGRGMAMPFPGA